MVPAPVSMAAARAPVSSVALMGAAGGQRGEPEVEDLDLVLLGHHDVAGLEVAVDDAGGMGRGERVDDLAGVAQRARQRQARLRDHRVERAAAHQLHREVLADLGRPDVEDRDDVRVLQRRGELRFLDEAAAALGLAATRSAGRTFTATRRFSRSSRAR